MFFPKLRRNAKWVFLFLALAFGLGFVAFGVGAGGVGVGDIFRGTGDSGIPSVSGAEERVNENPKDAQAWRDLATAHQAANQTDGAIQALETYVGLRPKDERGLRDLAALYLVQLGEAQNEYQLAVARTTYLAPASAYFESITLGGRPLDLDPISQAVTSSTAGETTAALTKAQSAAQKSVETYKKIVALTPDDPSVQLQLGDAAASVGDTATAIAAYERYIELVPADDPTARKVRRLIKQLSASTPG
jgi:regulator of sirC expression with transglutaminase-like and TPR domain